MGEVAVSRRYYAGRSCTHKDIPWDRWAGVTSGHLTPHAHRLAVLAGSSWSFDVASQRLKQFCGIRLSDQTIREVTDRAGAEAGQWLANSPEPLANLQKAQGNGEFYTDGTCVNTRAGWREMRINIFAVRPAGPSVGPEQWSDRYLPPTEARLAWGGIHECRALGPQWRVRADALGWNEGRGLSVLADGAKWIWNQVAQHLPASECVVDVFHISEHLHACGRTLFGETSPQAQTWAEQQLNSLIGHGPMRLFKNLENPADPAAKHPAVQALMEYLKPNIDGLWYADRLRRGLPIGSGMVEGACKNVIGRRMKCNSARWLAERADHMASLCCLHYSDHWEQFWARLAA